MSVNFLNALVTGLCGLLGLIAAAGIAACVSYQRNKGDLMISERETQRKDWAETVDKQRQRIAELEARVAEMGSDGRAADGRCQERVDRLTEALRYWVRRECQNPEVWMDMDNMVHAHMRLLRDTA